MSKTEVFKKFGPIQIDDARINETCNAYFKWKDCQQLFKSSLTFFYFTVFLPECNY